jgi:hypothetical protein
MNSLANMSNDRICILFMSAVICIILYERVKMQQDNACPTQSEGASVVGRVVQTLRRVSNVASSVRSETTAVVARATTTDKESGVAPDGLPSPAAETKPKTEEADVALSGQMQTYRSNFRKASVSASRPMMDHSCGSSRVRGTTNPLVQVHAGQRTSSCPSLPCSSGMPAPLPDYAASNDARECTVDAASSPTSGEDQVDPDAQNAFW